MTYIITRGLEPIQRKIAKELIQYCVDKFMPRLSSKITIKLRGKNNLLKKYVIYGNATYEELGEYRPRDFIIDIDNTISLDLFARTLLHEMVHIKQWAKGEMVHMEKTGYTKWHREKLDSENMEYYDHPWEIEAHGREEGLLQSFLSENIKWEKYIHESIKDHTMYRSTQMVFPFYR